MTISLDRNTLAYHLTHRPLARAVDLTHVPLTDVVGQMNTFFDHDNLYHGCDGPTGLHSAKEPAKGNPEADALYFYMLNHAMSLVRQRVHPLQPLGPYLPVVETYFREASVRAVRMICYMLLICTREARHDHKAPHTSMGEVLAKFHSSLKGQGSDDAAMQLRKHPPNVSLGQYTEFLTKVFYKGQFSSGYGGKAWGQVADVLNDYVHGKLSAEMLMDTAFTLCHNNGPIFNKGMLFSTYGKAIYRILDVQRSGQIPQYVASSEMGVTPAVSSLHSNLEHILGDDFTGYVDWYKVEALGSKNKYPKEKADQASKYGVPAGYSAAASSQPKPSSGWATVPTADDDVLGQYLVLMPGFKVKKITRKELA